MIEGAIQFDNGKNKRAIDLGTKCPAPLCMSWFGASREDRFPDDWQYREKMGRFPEKRPLEKWLELPELPSEGKFVGCTYEYTKCNYIFINVFPDVNKIKDIPNQSIIKVIVRDTVRYTIQCIDNIFRRRAATKNTA